MSLDNLRARIAASQGVTPPPPIDIPAIVREYLKRGWSPIPVPHKSKKPVLADWTNYRLAQREGVVLFGRKTNVGVLLGPASGDLVDVDLDSAEARKLADTFLPRTGSVFGRRSNPAPHRLYVSAIEQTSQFKTPGGRMIIEARFSGAQTIFPPSAHPSGERIRWESDGEPAQMDAEELLAAVRKVAAGALIAQNWPAEGGRHDFALALAGALLRSMMPDDIIEFIEAVADVAGDDEAEDRGHGSVGTTLKRQRSRSKTTGWPTVVDHLGQDVVDRVIEWLRIETNIEPPKPPPPLERVGVEVYTPFPVDALPKIIADFVRISSTAIGADPSYVALPLLSA